MKNHEELNCCPFCRSKNIDELLRKVHRGIWIYTFICNDCDAEWDVEEV